MEADEILQAFGRALKDARTSEGLSQEALAEALDVDRTYVSLLESGKRNPSLLLLNRIGKVLAIHPKDLIPD